MESLDPRINRLSIPDQPDQLQPKVSMDQLGTFEVFLQLREGKPYMHVGAVHAPNNEMAFVFAKEQFSRRLVCSGLFVVETRNVRVTQFTEGEDTVYNYIGNTFPEEGEMQSFEVFHLNKRGKQHEHMGAVEARNYDEVLALAKPEFINDKSVYNVWVVKTSDILFNNEEDKIIWDTLPDKKFRDAIAYKASDKIKEFKERQQTL